MTEIFTGLGVGFVWLVVVCWACFMVFKHVLNRGVDWDKPSSIFKAVADSVEAVKDNPLYVIDFSVWHFTSDHYTRMSLAGAVMAHILKVEPNDNANPDMFNDKISRVLVLVEEIEEGRSQRFVKLITGVDKAKGLKDFNGIGEGYLTETSINEVIAVCRHNAKTLKGLGL